MILSIHGVFLAWTALLLAWNFNASRKEQGATPWERRWLLPLAVLLFIVLLRDRLFPFEASWLFSPLLAWAFPLLFAGGIAQNISAISSRGIRLTDIPILLHNVGLGLCTGVGAWALTGNPVTPSEASLLYDYSILQVLLGGSRLTYLSTLSWHLPAFCPRQSPTSLTRMAIALTVPAVCAFVVLTLATFKGPSDQIIASFFRDNGSLSSPLRSDLSVGVFTRDPHASPPGNVTAWILPANHDGEGLPHPNRPLVLSLRAPDHWAWQQPEPDLATEVFIQGAVRLAATFQPAVLLPFPEPDEEAVNQAGLRLSPDAWHALYRRVRKEVRAVSPQTRIGARLATIGSFATALHRQLAQDPQAVDILGPRLQPAGTLEGFSSIQGGAAWVDSVLFTWKLWREDLPSPPSLWILAGGASHMAFGKVAQGRFVQSCLDRADADLQIEGILLDGWRDVGHTLGLENQPFLDRLPPVIPQEPGNR